MGADYTERFRSQPLKFVARPLMPAELLPAPKWLIKGVLPEGFLTILKGLPGSFKTYIADSMALCLAAGLPWCGRQSKPCIPLYIAADDPDGPLIRAQAWGKHHGISAELIKAMVFNLPVNLHQQLEVERAAENILRQGLKPDLIIWDTLFHSSLGADLRKPEDVLPIFGRERWLMKEVSAHTGLTLHHTPKDGVGFFGSVSLEGTVDVILHSEQRDPNTAVLSCERMRRSRRFAPMEIKLTSLKIETLPDDEGATVIEEMAVTDSAAAPAKAPKQESDLSKMEYVLEVMLGNKATSKVWQKAMVEFSKSSKDPKERTGWSKASFQMKLDTLKKRGRVTGGGGQGEYYSVTYARGGVQPDGADGGFQEVSPGLKEVQSKAVQSSPPKGDWTSWTAFRESNSVQTSPIRPDWTGSPQDRKDENSVASAEDDLVTKAMKQLKAKTYGYSRRSDRPS